MAASVRAVARSGPAPHRKAEVTTMKSRSRCASTRYSRIISSSRIMISGAARSGFDALGRHLGTPEFRPNMLVHAGRLASDIVQLGMNPKQVCVRRSETLLRPRQPEHRCMTRSDADL